MGKIYTSSAQLIGHTPLLELSNIEKQYGLKAKAYCKAGIFQSVRFCKGSDCKDYDRGCRGRGKNYAGNGDY